MSTKLNSIISNLSEAILILDQRGEILFSTDYVKKIAGYESSELKGKSSFDLVYLHNNARIKRQYEKMTERKNVVLNTVLRIKHKEGQIVWTELTAKNLLHDKHIKGILITAKDLALGDCDQMLTKEKPEQDENSYNEVVEKFNKLLQNNFTKERSVGFYAAALHMHPNRLNFLVKKHTGISAKQSIIDYIIDEAKFLLGSSSLNVKEISYQLGFDDPNYFSAFFRKKMKISPVQFRR